MTSKIQVLFSRVPPNLVSALLTEYNKIKTNFIEGKWEPSELGGGKFSEVVFRILEWHTGNIFTPLGRTISNFAQTCRNFENKPTTFSESVRLHIPRVIIALYDIRNHRGVGHVSGDVNPNHMDSTYVVSAADWIMAELVRIFHNVSTEQAQNIVEGIITKNIPVVWNLGDKKRILNPELSFRGKMLVLLYDSYPESIDEGTLIEWVEHSNPSVFRRDVIIPSHKDCLIDYNAKTKKILISPTGRKFVEKNIKLTI